MKPIRKLSGPIPGLAAYLEACSDGKASWEAFRNHSASASYRELVEALVALQHGLCGYCEIDLRGWDRQVEHVIPRSDPDRGSAEELNHGNLAACCLGGAAKSLYGPDATDDSERYLEPASENLSCGQAKGERNDAAFVDPRTIPPLHSVTEVNHNGEIEADPHACANCGVDVNRVARTIDILGLNVERLRRDRESHWRALNQNWHAHFDDPQKMVTAVYAELLPDSNGVLPRFLQPVAATSRRSERVFSNCIRTAGFEPAPVAPRRVGRTLVLVHQQPELNLPVGRCGRRHAVPPSGP